MSQSNRDGRNCWVFRDGKHSVSGASLRDGLARTLERLRGEAGRASRSSHRSEDERELLLNAVLRAGELECALADAAEENDAWRGEAGAAARLADGIAAAYAGRGTTPLERLAEMAAALRTPDTLRIATPEGFTYYALHPLDYVRLLARFAWPSSVLVVGVRSIGTTLGAVVAAALAAGGSRVARWTVRPTGHPYDRSVALADEQRADVRRLEAQGAGFLVVDEGPGLSGSSFLATAEALVAAGAAPERITVLCSRPCDPDRLLAQRGAERWRRFRALHVASTRELPERAKEFFAGGLWRERTWSRESWPGCWTQMERLKFLSPDGRSLFKYVGLGAYGERVVERYRRAAEAGFGPMPLGFTHGFVELPMLSGHLLAGRAWDDAVLARVAAYCAWRAEACSAPGVDTTELRRMASFNVAEEFGLPFDPEALSCPELPVVRPVVADGKMEPWEWLHTDDGRLLKLDSGEHGDNHFFPGPTDIAWDLAGAVVEWNLDAAQTERLLGLYRAASGDDARERLRGYLYAYLAFRMSYFQMGAMAMEGSDEAERLRREKRRYRARLVRSVDAAVPLEPEQEETAA